MAEPGRGPLVLGSGGRVGRMLRRLAAQGLWPGPEPLWHTRDGREGTLGWDMGAGRLPDWPPLPPLAGLVVLAGRTGEASGPAGAGRDRRALDLGPANEAPASAARRLARDLGAGPVLLCSSAAVYGAAAGPGREDGPAEAHSAYGLAKLFMEGEVAIDAALRPRPPTCCLRIGNVAGADALFGAMASGPVTLDRLPDGTAPRRAYVGPLTLARALVALLAAPALPPVLNLAQPGLVGMDAVLRAAGVPFAWRDNPAALPALEMDLARLHALAPLPPATPEALVAEARLAGWRAHGEAA